MKYDEINPISRANDGYKKGLNKREYFTALAMSSFIINSDLVFKIQEKSEKIGLTTDFDEIIALASISLADEVLNQLEKNR